MGTAWQGNGMGTAWQGNGMGTAWQGNGMSATWAGHGHGMLCVNRPLMGSCVDPKVGFYTSVMKKTPVPAWILFQSVAYSLYRRSSPGNTSHILLPRLLYLVNIRTYNKKSRTLKSATPGDSFVLHHIPTVGGKHSGD